MESRNCNMNSKYPYNLITNYFNEAVLKKQPRKFQLMEIMANELIVPERLDLMAKWFYIDCKEKNMDMHDARELYYRHIEAFSCGTFREDGTEEKNSIQKYFEEFDNLIEDIKLNGFDDKKSLIPIGDDNIILDGSHRCVCAAYFGKKITVIKFEGLVRNYNYNFFKERLLDNKYLDKMVYQYCKIKVELYLACIWPAAGSSKNRVKALDLIEDACGKIIYSKDIKMNYQGIYNLMIQAYGHQKWAGDYTNKHAGIKDKADNCFKKGYPLSVVIFQCSTYESVLSVKEKIREIYNIDNHSIHITDDTKETVSMAELLLNNNSIHHLKYGNPDFSLGTNIRLTKFKDEIMRNYLPIEDFIVDASSVLSIYGIREAMDLDFLTTYKDLDFKNLKEIDNHESQMKYFKINKNDMIYNSNNFFVYNGIKFISLKCLKEMKAVRNESKDRRDIRKLNYFLFFHRINSEYLPQLKNRYLRYRRINPSKTKVFLENIKNRIFN